MNIRSQFDYINGQTPYDNLDTLNFTQLSQNMALNTLYNFWGLQLKLDRAKADPHDRWLQNWRRK
jgi:hypothetical protein